MSDLNKQDAISVLSILSERGEMLAQQISSLLEDYKHMNLDYACAEIDFESGRYEFGAEFSEPWCDGGHATLTFDIDCLLSEEAMEAKMQSVKTKLKEKERERQDKIKERERKEREAREDLDRREYERLKDKFGGSDNG